MNGHPILYFMITFLQPFFLNKLLKRQSFLLCLILRSIFDMLSIIVFLEFIRPHLKQKIEFSGNDIVANNGE